MCGGRRNASINDVCGCVVVIVRERLALIWLYLSANAFGVSIIVHYANLYNPKTVFVRSIG